MSKLMRTGLWIMVLGVFSTFCFVGKGIETSFDFGAGDGSFQAGTPLKIDYKVKNELAHTLKCYVAGSVSSSEGTILHSFKRFIQLDPGQSDTYTFYYQPQKAGIYQVYAHIRNANGTLSANSTRMAYAPLEVQSPLTKKQDFEQFWQSTLNTLKLTAPDFRIIAKPSLYTADYEVFLVEMQSLGNVKVRGWYRRPKGKTKVPVILQLPSLGGAFYNVGSLEDRPKHGVPIDFAVFSLNVRGHGNSKEYLDVGTDYHRIISHGLESRETYIYRGAIADCIRALDFLDTRPEIDQQKIAVEGASQGGALSLFTAGLDKRVSLCAPDVPFLSDIENLFVLTNWVSEEMKRYQKTTPSLSTWRVQYNLSYFDTKNFAAQITAPVLMSIGLQDTTCPALTGLATYNKISAIKKLYIYPLGGHQGGGALHRKRKFEWIKTQWGM